jgi:hypothetical protein
MRKYSIVFFIVLCLSSPAFAQMSNGEVSSLVAAENYFVGIAKEKGTRKAFLDVSDDETIIFRPGPVKATKFFDKPKADEGELLWKRNLCFRMEDE